MIIIKKDYNDILHFLIKAKQTKWSLSELSQELLIPKRTLTGMLVYLQCHGYVKREKNNSSYLYSLINN